MGKLAILVLGVVIGSTWMAGGQPTSATPCVDSAPSSESAGRRSEPDDREDRNDYLEKIRVVGGELWHRIVQPMLASAATHTLDALVNLLRNVAADNAQSDGRSHASLDRKVPATPPPARE